MMKEDKKILYILIIFTIVLSFNILYHPWVDCEKSFDDYIGYCETGCPKNYGVRKTFWTPLGCGFEVYHLSNGVSFGVGRVNIFNEVVHFEFL
jgi:hypothetical protein